MNDDFFNKNEVNMANLIKYFQLQYPELVKEMKESTHHLSSTELSAYHIEGDIFTHTMLVCLNADKGQSPDKVDKVELISALLHDIGKPASRTISEGKVRFNGHEGLSFYMAIDILTDLVQKSVITMDELKYILSIINLHGTLNDIMDSKNATDKIIKKLYKKPKLLKYLIKAIEYDHQGRFHLDNQKGFPEDLNEKVQELIDKSEKSDNVEVIESTKTKKLTLLCGVPNVGKSTWIKNYGKGMVISRDNSLMVYANDNNISGDYSEVWDKLTKEDHKEIDKMTMAHFQDSVKQGKDIIVDLTNLSKKSRKKWVSQITKEYSKEAIIFVSGYDEIFKRNEIRNKEQGKHIPKEAISSMMKSFTIPTYEEVDKIHWAFS